MTNKQWNFRITPLRLAMMAMFFASLVVILFRFYTGLGYTTNLSDAYPWGLWIWADLTVIALAGAGFSMAVITHVLHIKKYKPLARRALLISFIGYIVVLLILIIEIGRWDNFWRPLVSPNLHSPMYEVFLCIVAYFILQLIELVEVGAEKVAPKVKMKMQKIMPVVFIIAALVPFGHQASLGAIFLAMPHKLHPIWSSVMIPWLFLLSAFLVGPAVVAVETLWNNKRYKIKTDTKMLSDLIKISGSLMIMYFVVKIGDLVFRGVIGEVFSGTLEGNMFILEMLFFTIIPVIICFSPFGRTNKGIAVFSISAMIGLFLTRFNAAYTGFHAHLGGGYVPSFVELFTTVGLLCFAFLAYTYIVENFPFFYGVPGEDKKQEETSGLESGYHQGIL